MSYQISHECKTEFWNSTKLNDTSENKKIYDQVKVCKQDKLAESSNVLAVNEDYEKKFMIRIYKNEKLFEKLENGSLGQINIENRENDSSLNNSSTKLNQEIPEIDVVNSKSDSIQENNNTNDLSLFESESESLNGEEQSDSNSNELEEKDSIDADSQIETIENIEIQASNDSINEKFENNIQVRVIPFYPELSFFLSNHSLIKSLSSVNSALVYEYVYNKTCRILYRNLESNDQLEQGQVLRTFYENF